MAREQIAGGVVHTLPPALKKALAADKKALALWAGLTPLARNEWICWAVAPKKAQTRAEHVERVISELKGGMRRPCCWIGCIHSTDKPVSPSVQGILKKRRKLA